MAMDWEIPVKDGIDSSKINFFGQTRKKIELFGQTDKIYVYWVNVSLSNPTSPY